MQTLQKSKQSKLGKIPEDWYISSIEDIAEIRGRIGWRGMTTKDYRNEGPILLGVTNISKNFVLKLDEITRISEERYKESPEIIVKNNDILLAKSGATTGKVCYVQSLPDRATVNAAVNIIRSKKNLVFPTYLFYFLSWDKIQKLLFQKSSAGAQPNLFQRDTKKIPVIIPLLSEQQKIASILSNVDELIQKKEQIIEQTQRLKKGLIQRLLTKGIGHTKFKKTELGYIPEEWQIGKLREYTTKIGSGITPRGGSRVYQTNGIPFIRSQNVHFDGLRLEDIVYISEKIDNEMKNSRIQPSDVLLNITGASIGRCTFVPEELKHGNVNQHVCIIRPKKEIDSIYLSFFLSSNTGQKLIHSIHHGLSREGLTFSQIAEFSVPLPKIDEQKQIVGILRSINSFIQYYESIKKNVIDIKKGLMQQLLTGKIRVKV